MRLILGSLIVTLISQLIEQIIPPFSILCGTTLLVPFGACFINFSDKQLLGIESKKDLPVLARIVLIYVCVIVSFVLDFLYSPGTHDAEGDAIVLFSSFVPLVISCVTMILYRVREMKNMKTRINPVEMTLIAIVPLSWFLANGFGRNILYELFG